jgi:hypothetical protein
VTAAGDRAFRKAYSFRSPHAREGERDALRSGVARVLAERGGTPVGGGARGLRTGPCEAVRRVR